VLVCWSILSIEYEAADYINYDTVIEDFARLKVLKVQF
jgi:hypothetical protein